MTNIEQLETMYNELIECHRLVDKFAPYAAWAEQLNQFITTYKNQYHIDKDKLEGMKKANTDIERYCTYNQAIDDVIKEAK